MRLVAGGFLLLLTGHDIRYKTIPVIPVIVMGGMLLTYRVWNGTGWMELIGGCLPGGIFLLISLLTREKIGSGDGLVLLALGCGFAIEEVVGIVGMALFFAAIVAIVLLVVKKASRKTEIPFVPFLFLGFLVTAAVTG